MGKNKKLGIYVVFSRVRKLSHLFLARPIPDNLDVLPAVEYLDMMTNLRQTILATPEIVAQLKNAL